MLTGLYRERYLELQQALQQVQAIATRHTPDGDMLQSRFLKAQQFFQQGIVSLELQGLSPAVATQVQSYQTEINKQLRLLGMDVMFLKTARQSVTAQQRQAQLRDRIDLIIRYCETLLGDNQDA